MADQDRTGERGSQAREGGPGREGAGVPDTTGGQLELPRQSPLFHAQHADRYDRQDHIRHYERRFGCRLVVVKDAIFPDSITFFEDLIYDADPAEPLHLMLSSPGGDGETAVRLARQAQSRCSELTVIVPDQAKSAATLLAMGAHEILMGPTSDLGPVDPQFQVEGIENLVSAKDILAALDAAERAVQERPETYPLHASLLANVTELMIQQARSAMNRTDQVAIQALRSNPDRSAVAAAELWEKLKDPLALEPADHSAVFDANDAIDAGLPVIKLDARGEQWQLIWRLYTKYLMAGLRVYEGRFASQILSRQ